MGNHPNLSTSVADPGCLTRIQDPNFFYPGYNNNEKEEGERIVLTFFVNVNFTKLKII
jgi:hypothetical protein